MPSEKLADIIIAFRYLGLFKDNHLDAMKELSRRRENGDSFDFEGYIETNLASLPDYKPDPTYLKSIKDSVFQLKNLIKI